MLKKKFVIIAVLSFSGAVAHQLVLAHDLGNMNDSYVGDSGAHLITDGFGDCIKTGSWNKENDLTDCGAAPFKAEAEPAPVPVARPAPAPAPAVVTQAVSLSAGALFDVNSDRLKDSGNQELSDLATHIKAMKEVKSVKVIGYTDSSGAESYNQALSQRRANAVKNYLVERGVSPTVVSTIGMGENQPVASNATREGRAKNRRVEIAIEGRQSR